MLQPMLGIAELTFRFLFFLGFFIQVFFNPMAGTLLILLALFVHILKDLLLLIDRHENKALGSFAENIGRAVWTTAFSLLSMLIIYLIRGLFSDLWLFLEIDQFVYLIALALYPTAAAFLALILE